MKKYFWMLLVCPILGMGTPPIPEPLGLGPVLPQSTVTIAGTLRLLNSAENNLLKNEPVVVSLEDDGQRFVVAQTKIDPLGNGTFLLTVPVFHAGHYTLNCADLSLVRFWVDPPEMQIEFIGVDTTDHKQNYKSIEAYYFGKAIIPPAGINLSPETRNNLEALQQKLTADTTNTLVILQAHGSKRPESFVFYGIFQAAPFQLQNGQAINPKNTLKNSY